MSNKIRFIFLIGVFIIFVLSAVLFNNFHSPLNPKIEKVSPFKITEISGNGKVFFAKTPIESSSYSSLEPVNIKEMEYSGPLYFMVEDHTAFEFYCAGTAFSVLPRSYLHYQSNTQEFFFYSGEFYWSKKVKDQKSPIHIYIRDPQKILALSEAGRIKIQDNSIMIWNYSKPGTRSPFINLKYTDREQQQEFNVNPNQLLVLKDKDSKNPSKIFDLLPGPENIDPDEKVVAMDKPDDSVVRFNWRGATGVKQFIFRLYSSDLKENILVEKNTQLSWFNLDLLQYEEREFYWEVFPVDINTPEQLEGIPSEMGHIQLTGGLLGKKDIQKPPQLTIKSVSVSGNLVIIKGNVDRNTQLYINDEPVKIDMEGEYIHYITYKSIGPKEIQFRLVSPLGVETTEVRHITIFDE